MSIIQMLGQTGAATTFITWVVISFLLGLFIGISIKGKVKTRETGETVSPSKEFVPPRQLESNNAALIAAITAAVNEYRGR